MSDFDSIVVFDKKTMSDIFKDIFTTSKKREKEITELIKDIKPLIKNSGDAVILVPIISKYLELSISNDEHIIKMMAIVQKASTRSKETGSDEPELTQAEREELFANYNVLTANAS